MLQLVLLAIPSIQPGDQMTVVQLYKMLFFFFFLKEQKKKLLENLHSGSPSAHRVVGINITTSDLGECR